MRFYGDYDTICMDYNWWDLDYLGVDYWYNDFVLFLNEPIMIPIKNPAKTIFSYKGDMYVNIMLKTSALIYRNS